jgi:hypothetical protein
MTVVTIATLAGRVTLVVIWKSLNSFGGNRIRLRVPIRLNSGLREIAWMTSGDAHDSPRSWWAAQDESRA